jgi:hypothetical protein
MTTDFRALCSELVALLDCFGSTFNIPIEAPVVTRARAALAQPKLQGPWPTDEELYDLWNQEGPEADFQECRRFARAVLARWGTLNPIIEELK